MRNTWSMAAAVMAGMAALGCEERGVTTTTVEKRPAENAGAPPAPPSSAPRVAASEPADPLTGEAGSAAWPLPEGWRVQPGSKPMRVATFEAPGDGHTLEVALSEFPGDAGGLVANINRWRGQVGLEPATLEQIEAEAVRADAGSVKGHIVHLRGSTSHMLGAVLFDSTAGKTRFLKATGPAEVVEQHKGEFEEFVRSLAGVKVGG